VGDAVIAFRLLNEARHRIMYRVFGMPREQSNLMTLFVIGAFVRALQALPRRQEPRCTKPDPARPPSATR
jgi:hypothetical protein